MHAPSIAIFIITVILAFIGVWFYIGAPVSMPELKLPIVGISTSEISPFLAANAFWLMFLAWVLLAIGALLPHRAMRPREAERAEPHAAAPTPAA